MSQMRGSLGIWLIGWVVAGLLAGCASRNRIDWDAQVGVITYDQVLLELGPPTHVATLEDGSRVAQWLVQTSRVYSTPSSAYGVWGPWGGGAMGAANVFSTPSVFLLLTFGPDQKLVSWRRQFK